MSLGSGQIRLHRGADPALDAGRYKVTLTAQINDAGPTTDRWIEVVGPRLRLEPQEISAASPPPNSVGDLAVELPYVALVRRTLPWERSGPAAVGGAWLALLVTREAPRPEAILGDGPLGDAVALAGEAPATTVSLLRVNTLGISAVRDQLVGVHRRRHVREISLADTATMGPDDDGWQAIVVGTRLAAGAAPPGIVWRATLVSLEGRTDLPLAAGASTATFLALSTWTFTSLSGGGTFAERSENLNVGRFAADAANGVTIERVDRAGRTGSVRYRSPLRPAAQAPAPLAGDDEVEDVTSTSAFELGRMLAAADGRLLRDLVLWRRQRQWAAANSVTDTTLGSVFGQALGTAGPTTLTAERVDGGDQLTRRSSGVARLMLATANPALPVADVHDTLHQAQASDLPEPPG